MRVGMGGGRLDGVRLRRKQCAGDYGARLLSGGTRKLGRGGRKAGGHGLDLPAGDSGGGQGGEERGRCFAHDSKKKPALLSIKENRR